MKEYTVYDKHNDTTFKSFSATLLAEVINDELKAKGEVFIHTKKSITTPMSLNTSRSYFVKINQKLKIKARRDYEERYTLSVRDVPIED